MEVQGQIIYLIQKKIRDKLEYMYPGEILLNMSQKEIADIFLKQN